MRNSMIAKTKKISKNSSITSMNETLAIKNSSLSRKEKTKQSTFVSDLMEWQTEVPQNS